MVVRVICIILAVAVPLGPITFIFVAGAIFLPYFAVIIANAQGSSTKNSPAKSVTAPTLTISPEAFKEAKPDEDK